MKRQVLGTWQQIMKIIRANKRMNSKWNDIHGYREIEVEQVELNSIDELVDWIGTHPHVIINCYNPITDSRHWSSSIKKQLKHDIYLLTLTL